MGLTLATCTYEILSEYVGRKERGRFVYSVYCMLDCKNYVKTKISVNFIVSFCNTFQHCLWQWAYIDDVVNFFESFQISYAVTENLIRGKHFM